jgi:hypothetical protein
MVKKQMSSINYVHLDSSTKSLERRDVKRKIPRLILLDGSNEENVVQKVVVQKDPSVVVLCQ